MRDSSLLVAAGGTGGHLYPAIAVATTYRELRGGAIVTFVGTERGLESSIVPSFGFPLEMVRAAPLRGGSVSRKLKGVYGLFVGMIDAVSLLKRLRPSVVMGVGAYVSGTIVLAAALRGIPTLILEPNAEPGLTNRWLAPFIDEAACGWEETTRFFRGKGVVTGNPVRASITAVAPLSETSRDMRVLVFGGSQGSRALNQAVVDALPLLSPMADRLQWTHQTGPDELESVGAAYRQHAFPARVVAYIDAMDEAYASADLVVSRAGATTCAELAACGRPAVLAPLALAGAHQEANAELLAKAGAARFIRSKDLSGERLAKEVAELADDPDARLRMARSARTLARPDAASDVARRLARLSGTDEVTEDRGASAS